jgi:hypothetical protein
MDSASYPDRLKWARIAGCVAILGALIGMVGDYCLLYSPEGGYMDGDYAFMRGISNTRLLWGHYLGILAIPLEAAGLYLIWLGLLPQGRRLAFAAVCAGMYLLFLGVSYHATVFPFGDAVRWEPWNAGRSQLNGAGEGTPLSLEAWRPFNEPLGLGFAAAFFALVLVFTVAMARGKTAYPRWVAGLSPLFVYGGVLIIFLLYPTIGNLLAPLGFNLSMAVFYGALTLTARTWILFHQGVTTTSK